MLDVALIVAFLSLCPMDNSVRTGTGDTKEVLYVVTVLARELED